MRCRPSLRSTPSGHRASGRIVPLVAVVALAFAACSGSSAGTPAPAASSAGAAPSASAVPSASAAASASASTDAGPVTDYSQPDNWLARPTAVDQPVDVFYLYPTAYRKATPDASNVAAVTDAGMRKGAQSAYARQATLFDGTANIYAPYYRQLDAVYALTLPQDQHVAAIAGAPTLDATAAFASYIEHDNGGRPFILASHSQGSDVMCNLLSGYLKDHPDVSARMIAAYVIGYSVTPTFLAANPHLEFAERADDTGVIISYNTEAPTIGAPNPVVLPGALAINPISWTRTEDPAPASASLGSWLPDSTGTFRKVEHYADARIDLAKGVLIASTPDESVWAPGQPGGFPAGVYHSFDYPFYYFDLQANAKVRVAAYLAAHGGGVAPGGAAVPLADALATLQPQAVWQHFYDLAQIPRPSHHEAKAAAFVADFGRSLGFETIVDSVGNVVIRKPATTGMEGRPGVVLQAHLDMVPQAVSGSTFDFLADPIAAVVQDGWVHAQGTTLGADDGIGVATIMALLDAKDVSHGPLEALFTVDEEDGFSGVSGLTPDELKGRIYINVDNEVEGQLLISSAGGVYVEASRTYAQVPTPAGATAVQVTIDGLLGGHSGADIGKGRGSAHQLMARLLSGAPARLGVRLASLLGGAIHNAIPSKAVAVVVVPSSQVAAFQAYASDFGATVSKELATADPKVAVTLAPVGLPAKVMAAADQATLVGAVLAAPQGIEKMSADAPGMVETSSNLGVLNIADGTFTATDFVRSALDSERDALAQRCAEVFRKAGATVRLADGYSSWPPNPASPLLALMKRVYANLFGAAPEVVAMHVGLETSIAGVTYPGMDMISVGPNLENVHTPDERLNVASVAKIYDLLVATLGQIE